MKKFNLPILLTNLALLFLVSGCSIYREGFECPPGRGIGCASTSEVLDMIVEKDSDSNDPYDDGKNLFVPGLRRCK